MKIPGINITRLFLYLLIFVILGAIGIYAFLASDIIKFDVSPPDSYGPVVVPENYRNLPALDVTIPSFNAGNVTEDIKIHDGAASSGPRNPLKKFPSSNWYTDYDSDGSFDGNLVSGNAEAIVLSDNNLLDASDTVEKAGLCLMKTFSISSGIGEQYIDGDHSQSYTTGEAVVSTSVASGKVYPGEVIRGGFADMTLFHSGIRFTDGINGNVTPTQYNNGEAIISSGDAILDTDDVVITQGNADLKPFPSSMAYTDSDGDTRYGSSEAILTDNGTSGKLDIGLLNGTGVDVLIRPGKANLKNMSGQGMLFADDNNDNTYTANELIVQSQDNHVDAGEVKLPGLGNLKSMSNLAFTDHNNDGQLDAAEAIIKNTGVRLDILENEDTVVSPGNAALKAFAANQEQFVDNDEDNLYDDGECIVHTDGVIEPLDISKPGKALLKLFSGNGYLFTEYTLDGKYTGDVDLTNGYQGEAIFKDLNSNGIVDNGELITPGYADLKPMPADVWYIDARSPNPRNGMYGTGEAVIKSGDNILSNSDTIIKPGPAFILAFDADTRWADINDNSQYNESELIVKSADNTLSNGEVVKPGYCNLLSLASALEGRLYSDNNGNNLYDTDELVLFTADNILDASDVVSIPGKACLLSLKNQSYTRYIDTNLSMDFDSQEAIIHDPGSDPLRAESILDITDTVIRALPGTIDIKPFGDDVTYIDHNGDGYFRGDSDNDVNWDVSPYFNHPNVVIDQDEVVLDDPTGSNHLLLDSGDVVLRPGLALLTNFSDNVAYTDDGDWGYDGYYGGQPNEAVIQDNNSNGILDSTDQVIVTGRALIRDFNPPMSDRYIDANLDGFYQPTEAVIVDSSPGGGKNGLLDAGALDGTGVDQIVTPGLANLKRFQRAEKFVDGNRNGAYDAGEAIVYDWYNPSNFIPDTNTFEGEYILAGNPDLVNPTGMLIYSQPGSRTWDMILLPSNPNKAPMVQMNHRPEHKYIDRFGKGIYNSFYSGVYEPIIWSANSDLEEGKLDATGIDKILAAGHPGARLWPDNIKWSDSNHDGQYQKNEAIVYDAGNDNIITYLGTRPSNDQIMVTGEADLKGFADMKYVDANYDGDFDSDELLVNDANRDNMVQNEEIGVPGLVPADLLLPFSSSGYRYCDSDGNSNFGLQEAIILDLPNTGILEATDAIVSPGYAGLTGFSPANRMLDSNHNSIYDGNEAITYGNSDQVMDASDEIVAPGVASSFDNTSFKFAAELANGAYNNGWLIVNDTNNDNIMNGNEIVTSGFARLRNFSLLTDRYSDSNHNNSYDYDDAVGFGEAIIVNVSGDVNKVEETDQIKTSGYADLQNLSGTTYKYSDSNRDNNYNDNELIVNDIDGNNKVDNTEIKRPGLANLKGFTADVMYSDDNRDNLYVSSEAIIRSADTDLGSNDEVLASGAAGIRSYDAAVYRFTDGNHDGIYNPDEAIVAEAGWGAADNTLEDSDIVLLSGSADIEQFTSDFMFLDDGANSNAYEDGEAIAHDSNNNNLLEPGEIITGGRAALWKFGTDERYIDAGQGGNANNGRYDQDEAIIRDSNTNGYLDYGSLYGAGTDVVLASGEAGLRRFRDDERYVDQNNNEKYDGQSNSEDIYLDKDNNGIVTLGDDALEYFAVINNGTATRSDLAAVKLWADRDKDGKFEPDTDDAPALASLVSDPSNTKLWYEGPAGSPPLSNPSTRPIINYTISGGNQRFFVTVDTDSNPVDGRNIQMSLPIKGVKTVFGSASPTDAPVTNAYDQKIDFANPNIAEITSPISGAIVNGLVILRANAGDTVQVGKVEFYKGIPGDGNTPIAIDEDGAPWRSVWNSSSLPYGSYTLYARVYDRSYRRPSQTYVIPHYKDSQGVSITIGEIEINIALTKGWNLISIPIILSDTTLDKVLQSIDGDYQSVWSYNGVWKRYIVGPEGINDLDKIEPRKGYWIYMINDGILKFTGDAVTDTALPLDAGWNLVGYSFLTPMNTADALSSIEGLYNSVWAYVNGQWVRYIVGDPNNTLNQMNPLNGYFIYAKQPCTWSVPAK